MENKYEIIEKYLDVNPYSRSQKKLIDIKALVIHWVGNANSSAMANRNYFNNLTEVNRKRKTEEKSLRYASAHEIIGLNGEVVLCVPPTEVAYHAGYKCESSIKKSVFGSKSPNYHSYGIETCHVDWEGNYSKETYNTLVNRLADLCFEFNLTENDILTHEDLTTGHWKDCPRYFSRTVDKEQNRLKKLREEVRKTMDEKIRNIVKEEILKATQTNYNGDTGWKITSMTNCIEALGIAPEWADKSTGLSENWLVCELIRRQQEKINELENILKNAKRAERAKSNI